MPQDEYRALNPRDKKQVRNRIGARRFRAKRKGECLVCVWTLWLVLADLSRSWPGCCSARLHRRTFAATSCGWLSSARSRISHPFASGTALLFCRQGLRSLLCRMIRVQMPTGCASPGIFRQRSLVACRSGLPG